MELRPSADVFLYSAIGWVAAIHVAVFIDRNELCAVTFFDSRISSRQEGEILNPALQGIADTDAHFPAKILVIVGFRIGDINVIVGIKKYSAGVTELRPMSDIITLLVEDLHAVVKPVGDEESATLIDRQRVNHTKLTGSITRLTPRLQKGAIWRIFDDAVVGIGRVAVSDEYVAGFGDHDVGWAVEFVITTARDTGIPEHHEHLAGGAEFDCLVTAWIAFRVPPLVHRIGHPNISFRIHLESVGPDEHAGTETLHDIARLIDFENRIEIRVEAFIATIFGIGRGYEN